MYDDEFYPPPECPVFEPTDEEFIDPLGYINKIRPIAEKCGICKIRPPPHWQPPFAIDVESFKFTPRVQRLNELGIHTRIRLQFIENVAKFWELQGVTFKLPHVGGKALDLYGLHESVKKYGGFQDACKNKKWMSVCTMLGLQKNFGTVLRQHYERILYPFDIMKSGVLLEALESEETRKSVSEQFSLSTKLKKKTMYKGSNVSLENLDLYTAQETADVVTKSKRKPVEEPLVADFSNNKELAKLQLFGSAGPKMVGLGVTSPGALKLPEVKVKMEPPETVTSSVVTVKSELKPSEIKQEIKTEKKLDKKNRTRSRGSDQIPYAILDAIDNCKICGKDNNDSLLMLCDGCDDRYHTFCLIPPLSNVPTGDWRCPKCISKEFNKKAQPYGFEQARKEYTLQTFGEMADAFKSEYFTKPVHMVAPEVVESEFWRLVGSLEENLAVEYGADIHVVNNGSGFPRLCDAEERVLTAEEEEYAKSGWNLNNLPVEHQSLLKSVSGEISGMKVPWLYVGMCFSAFCWHIEDHWTYSINYIHWGEPKTWYGVPREDALKLEQVMHDSAPQLFNNHPDLLHHLVTTMNPTTLMKHGVRVCRTNQCAGEFMITFPRAYHAGFNQGYNFAEAVNFCPADWVPVGRQCVAHYRKMRKSCVFSHEEVVCKVANNPENLDVQVAAVIYKDMVIMLKDERELRKKVQEMGVTKAEREAFELVPDDERQCLHCLTTCFLSGVTCPCSPDRLVCLHHVDKLCAACNTADYVLRYRYSLDELPPILYKLKQRAEAFDSWTEKVERVFAATEKSTLPQLKVLVQEAEKGNFPINEKLTRLKSVVHEAEICSRVAQQLVNTKKHRTRIKDPTLAPVVGKCSLTLAEIQAFYKQLQNLPCAVTQLDQVLKYINNIKQFITNTDEKLSESEPTSEELLKLLDDSTQFDLDLPQITRLYEALQQARWLEDVRKRLLLDVEPDSTDFHPTPVTLEQLRQLIDAGVSVAPKRSVERAMAELQELLTLAEGWEEKAKGILCSATPVPMSMAVLITEKATQIPVNLPQCNKLSEVLRKAKIWESKVKSVQGQDFYPYVEVLESLATQARPLCIKLEPLKLIEGLLASSRTWKERMTRIFLKKNGQFSLLQVLNPRTDVRSSASKPKRKKLKENGEEAIEKKNEKSNKFDFLNSMNDPSRVVSMFKEAERHEVELVRNLRAENDRKSTGLHSLNNSQHSEPNNDDNDDASQTTYCICKKPSSGFMLQCEVCHDWFHTSCVPLPKLNNNKSKQQQVYELKFLCPLCHRSRRPHLSSILSLLLQLQKLSVRIREGEALQCLTERAMTWQDRARKVLGADECQFALLEALKRTGETEENGKAKEQKKKVEIRPAPKEGRDLIDDTIDAVIQSSTKNCAATAVDTLLSAASHAERRISSQSDISDAKSTDHEDLMEAAETLAMIATFSGAADAKVASNQPQAAPEYTVSNNSSENNKVVDLTCSEVLPPAKKEAPEHKLNGSSQPERVVTLSDGMRDELENLMLEGDLLEVTLNETQLIWKILQAAQPIKEEKGFVDFLGEGKSFDAEKTKITEKRKKKPKVDEKSSKKDKVERKRKRKETKQEVVAAAMALSTNEDDEYAFCSVSVATRGQRTCLQPMGDEVNWVQCDGGCEEWFHCLCVNISASQAKESEYVCTSCRGFPHPNLIPTKHQALKRSTSRDNSDASMDVDIINTAPPSPCNA